MDVELSERYRISGTYGERFLMNALPIPALIVLFLLARNGVNAVSALDMFLIIGIGSLLIWIIDPEPARRKQPVELIDGTVLRVGNSLVTPDSILSITPLRIYKGWTPDPDRPSVSEGYRDSHRAFQTRPDLDGLGPTTNAPAIAPKSSLARRPCSA
mgnify:CR=1 FL=1